ncbi:MAG: hypothetical protein N3A70_00795, partial [Anoxybacillus gonensis]|nr:hypothetical protein [Anoxybacillus gonensis]
PPRRARTKRSLGSAWVTSLKYFSVSPPQCGAERLEPMALGARHQLKILCFLIFKKTPSQ